MAGPYVGTLMMRGVRSGRKYVLSWYSPAAAAVNTYVRMDWNHPASAVSPNDFTVPELVDVIDFLPVSPTGTVEITSDGQRTSVVLDYAAFTAAVGVAGRAIAVLPRLQPLKTYRALVVVALAA